MLLPMGRPLRGAVGWSSGHPPRFASMGKEEGEAVREEEEEERATGLGEEESDGIGRE